MKRTLTRPVQRRRTPALRPRRPPVLLAMVVGLAGGLMLADPLSSLIGVEVEGGEIPGAVNPFASWSRAISHREVLLLGTDVSGGNTDVIATLRVNGDTTVITQIPRDAYIEAERYGPLKINALYAMGGTDAIKRELSSRVGRDLPNHLIVNLSAIRRMADLMGGIDVDVPKRMAYVDNSQGLVIDLHPGPQNLRGRDLEGFLRFRHDERGDIGRLERQQLALQALFRKMTRPDQLLRLPALMVGLGEDIQTDMGPMELGGLITAMGGTRLETRQLDGRPFDYNGISYLDVSWPQASSIGDGDAPNPEPSSSSSGRFRFLF